MQVITLTMQTTKENENEKKMKKGGKKKKEKVQRTFSIKYKTC